MRKAGCISLFACFPFFLASFAYLSHFFAFSVLFAVIAGSLPTTRLPILGKYPNFPFKSARFPIRIAFCSPFQSESDRHRSRINATTIMNLTQRLLLRSQQPRQRHRPTRLHRPNLSPLRANRTFGVCIDVFIDVH